MNHFPDSQPFPRTEALAPDLRRWRCEFMCDGRTFVATVEASNEAAAHSLARHELRGEPGFSSQRATLRGCVEV